MKKNLARKVITSIITVVMAFNIASCSGNQVNSKVPDDTDVTLNIEKFDENDKVFGIGTELDPHFLSQNVGLSGVSKGVSWECKESDWKLFESRIEEMNLKRIRVMLLPGWYVINEANTKDRVYNYDSPDMKSLYQVLDTAMKYDIKVNVTMWGIDKGNASFMRASSSEWVTTPNEDNEQLFVDCFADCVKYLIEEKNYSCIKEVTLFNEPNSLYLGLKANEDYCDLCKKMNESFLDREIRDKVLFNLSDDARDYKWCAKTLMNLEGIIDISNSHIYTYGDQYDEGTGEYVIRMSNEDMCYNLANYNLNLFKEYTYDRNVPHMWGEFGTCNGSGSHQTSDTFTATRGLDLARMTLNFFNMGSVGASYWVLFSQYYSRSDFNSGNIMDMGLWGFADEGYACRPMYYAYSMITRFVEENDVIYPLVSSDGNIVGVAFNNKNEWSYCIVNDGTTDKKVSFLNNNSTYPKNMNVYVYDEANVPTDNKVIHSSGTLESNGKVITATVKARSFVIYSNK